MLTLLSQINSVGVIQSPANLKTALAFKRKSVDLLEIRADAFANREEPLLEALPKLRHPLILTVRHPAEGGLAPLNATQRRQLFEKYLSFATFIDIEIRSLRSLAPILSEARAMGKGIILSAHDFHKTPSVARLRELVQRAHLANSDVVKIATTTSQPADIARLLSLFEIKHAPRLSLMGMGPLGKVSRLLFARAGSVLNYGHLGAPQVSGQWPAELLKQRIAELSK